MCTSATTAESKRQMHKNTDLFGIHRVDTLICLVSWKSVRFLHTIAVFSSVISLFSLFLSLSLSFSLDLLLPPYPNEISKRTIPNTRCQLCRKLYIQNSTGYMAYGVFISLGFFFFFSEFRDNLI